MKAAHCAVLLLFGCAATFAADSLAPPAARALAGLPDPVTLHPDQHRLLASGIPELAPNKRLAFEFWRHVIVGGKAEETPLYLHPDFIEHNPLLPSGHHPFQEYVADRVRRNAVTSSLADLVTLVAEGPYVVLVFSARHLESDGSGAIYTSAHFEMFRIEDGLIAEHWDSLQFGPGQPVPDYGAAQAIPAIGATGLAQHALLLNADTGLSANKHLVFDLWRHTRDAGREEMAPLYVAEDFLEHDPNGSTGREGFRAATARLPDAELANTLADPLVAMLAEGDLVVQVRLAELVHGARRHLLPAFDMFRIEDARVAEHWSAAVKPGTPAIMESGPLRQ